MPQWLFRSSLSFVVPFGRASHYKKETIKESDSSIGFGVPMGSNRVIPMENFGVQRNDNTGEEREGGKGGQLTAHLELCLACKNFVGSVACGTWSLKHLVTCFP